MKKNLFKENLWDEDFYLVERALNDDDLDAYDQLKYHDFYEKFVESSKILLKIIETNFDPDINDTILKMAFVYSVTTMESYFKKALLFISQQKPEFSQDVLKELNARKPHKSLANNLTSEEKVFQIINKRPLQNPKKISKLFSILGIETEKYAGLYELDELNEYIKLRHGITHRDEELEEGRKKLIDLVKRIRFFVGQINSEIETQK